MIVFEIVLWFILVIIGLVIAGLGSGLETGIYSINPVRLHVLEHSGSTSARLLARHIASPAALIASMLIVHNAGVKLATHAAAVLLKEERLTGELTEWQIVGFDALIMMPLLFVFAETVPKNLFALYADRLMYQFSRPMAAFVYVCRYSGLSPLLTGVSNLFMRILKMRGPVHSFHPRYQVQTLVKEGVGHGLLNDEQLALVERVMTLGGQTVENHMQPWKRVILVRDDDPTDVLWRLANETSRTRFPVVDGDGRFLGVLDITEVLVHEPQRCPPLAKLIRDCPMLEAATPLRHALEKLRTSPMPLAVVTRQDQPVGIITLKDLIEPLTGELVAW